MSSVFKVGDKITIKKDLKICGYYYGDRGLHKIFLNSDMRGNFGKKATVERVFEINGDIFYKLKEDFEKWSWSSLMFKESEKQYDFEEQKTRHEYKLLIRKLNITLPYRLSLKKVWIIKNRMICYFEDKYTKEVYGACSVCNKNDLFVFETGVMICAYRVLDKITQENLKKIVNR
ncbi:hypothetical protein UT300003_32470 [Clostridium sardiniense]